MNNAANIHETNLLLWPIAFPGYVSFSTSSCSKHGHERTMIIEFEGVGLPIIRRVAIINPASGNYKSITRHAFNNPALMASVTKVTEEFIEMVAEDMKAEYFDDNEEERFPEGFTHEVNESAA